MLALLTEPTLNHVFGWGFLLWLFGGFWGFLFGFFCGGFSRGICERHYLVNRRLQSVVEVGHPYKFHQLVYHLRYQRVASEKCIAVTKKEKDFLPHLYFLTFKT